MTHNDDGDTQKMVSDNSSVCLHVLSASKQHAWRAQRRSALLEKREARQTGQPSTIARAIAGPRNDSFAPAGPPRSRRTDADNGVQALAAGKLGELPAMQPAAAPGNAPARVEGVALRYPWPDIQPHRPASPPMPPVSSSACARPLTRRWIYSPLSAGGANFTPIGDFAGHPA